MFRKIVVLLALALVPVPVAAEWHEASSDHFVIGNSKFTMPRWHSEGAAEFFASAVFERDGSVSIGRPAEHRFREIAYADPVSLEELFDYDLYDRRKKSSSDSFYGQSWLLYHYLSFTEERQGQLTDYQVKIANGMTSIDAAREVFGDFKQLNRDLSEYKRKSTLLSVKLSPDKIKIGDIAIRGLSEGEAAMMPVLIRSQRGVDREQALELLPEARAIAAEYPDDPGVLTALAEAEFDAGNDAEAIAAADKAIAADPARKNAYVQKGYALFRLADDAEDEGAAMKRAMAPFSALNKLENDHPLPLIYYYRSFTERGVEPSEQAKLALIRASELAPFDQGLRFQVGMMHAIDGRFVEAQYTLLPLANDPHRASLSRHALLIVTALKNAKEGEKFIPPIFTEDPDLPEEDSAGKDQLSARKIFTTPFSRKNFQRSGTHRAGMHYVCNEPGPSGDYAASKA